MKSISNTNKEKTTETKKKCINCKHRMFSDWVWECTKQPKVLNPDDSCEMWEEVD